MQNKSINKQFRKTRMRSIEVGQCTYLKTKLGFNSTIASSYRVPHKINPITVEITEEHTGKINKIHISRLHSAPDSFIYLQGKHPSVSRKA